MDGPAPNATVPFCPACGIGLSKSDFDTPEKDYYCPFCSTRQAPSVL
jgi:rubredoxin